MTPVYLLLSLMLSSCTGEMPQPSSPEPKEPETTYNVFGKVSCEGQGVKNVWICDGEQWVKTDEKGEYSLTSEKKAGYVYVQMPSGYEVSCDGCWPQFWKTLSGTSVKDEVNFELQKVEDNRHIALVSADWQLRAVNLNPQDYKQARAYFDEVKAFKASQNVPVFSISLGDESWDSFWYRTGFDIGSFRSFAKDFPVPFYTVIGNHDHDMRASDDYTAAAAYRKNMGPENFSFNRGQVHYIIMDNVLYDPSDRSCTDKFTEAQLEWLRTDLSHVVKETPIIFCAHVPMHGWSWSNSTWSVKERGVNYSEALDMLERFDNVHIFAGHSHLHEVFDCKAAGLSPNNMYEHKIVALGGDLWLSATTIGYNISRDGVPSGYEILEVDGRNISWRFKSLKKDEDLQLRVYSLSEVKKYWASNEVVTNFVESNPSYSFESLYQNLPENAVLVNVFDCDPLLKCRKLEISDENGSLQLHQCRIKDPKSVVALEGWWWEEEMTLMASSYQTAFTQHIFYVIPSKENSQIKVELSDNEGNVIASKNYQLPIEFNCNED